MILACLSFSVCALQNFGSVIVYDRQSLLDIGFLAGLLPFVRSDNRNVLPSCVDCLEECCIAAPPLLSLGRNLRRKCRKRDCHGGRLVKLKIELKTLVAAIYDADVLRAKQRLSAGSLVSWRLWDSMGSWSIPVAGFSEGECVASVRFQRCCLRGVNLRNLRPVVKIEALPNAGVMSMLKWGLINARSVANKTFILKEFFVTHTLDILCITESWISSGEWSAVNELVPADCVFIGVPRTSRRGGGLAVICKTKLQIKQLYSVTKYSSFELCLFELGHLSSLLCAVVYRPPRYNKDFISEFSEFLAEYALRYDQIMLLGDYNIHVCCPEKPLVSDFYDLINCFNLNQYVSGATHVCGHTLDLVLFSGLDVKNLCIQDAVFSDHKPILFDITFHSSVDKHIVPVRFSRFFNQDTFGKFSLLFNEALTHFLEWSSLDELLNYFNEICKDILDTIAPLRLKKESSLKNQWSTDVTRAARRECRRYERQWKKNKLNVSLIALRESWKHY